MLELDGSSGMSVLNLIVETGVPKGAASTESVPSTSAVLDGGGTHD